MMEENPVLSDEELDKVLNKATEEIPCGYVLLLSAGNGKKALASNLPASAAVEMLLDGLIRAANRVIAEQEMENWLKEKLR